MTDTATEGWWEPTDEEMAEQRAARDAIQSIDLFPELQTRLTAVYGPTAERDMVHQMIYWLSKTKMQQRWTIYLTRQNWRDQRGLNRKQVDRGRARLRVHPAAIVAEKVGPYKRVHYRIDWVALAEVLDLRPPLKGAPSSDESEAVLRPPLKGAPEPSAPPEGDTISSATPETGAPADTYEENTQDGRGPSNTGDYPGDYLQEIPLTEGGDGSESRTAPGEIDKEQLVSGVGEPQPDADTTQPTDAEQQGQSAKGNRDDSPHDNEAPPMADAWRVARATVALSALLGEWPGFWDDVKAGKWRELGWTIEHEGFAEEIFAPVEVELAARGLEGGTVRRAKVAIHG
jgi:hypothetical protein